MNGEDEVRARLAGLPHPPIPADVSAAISARLAQEAHSSGREDAEVVPFTARHRRRFSGLLVAAAVAGIAMLMAVTVTPAGQQGDEGPPVIRAGAIYEPDHFADQVRQRFLNAPATSAPTHTFADSTVGIVTCADAVDAFGHVLAVDTGSYDDRAAVVIVTSYPANTQYEEVWVVSPVCGPSDPAVIRHMVYDVDASTANL
ncbi:MAG: hypothetical protein U0R23_05385 [Candidatus Nanopelagicales bacterium]